MFDKDNLISLAFWVSDCPHTFTQIKARDSNVWVSIINLQANLWNISQMLYFEQDQLLNACARKRISHCRSLFHRRKESCLELLMTYPTGRSKWCAMETPQHGNTSTRNRTQKKRKTPQNEFFWGVSCFFKNYRKSLKSNF